MMKLALNCPPPPRRIPPLVQIFRIRETHEELSKLLRSDEAQSLGIGEVFAPFARVPALQVSLSSLVTTGGVEVCLGASGCLRPLFAPVGHNCMLELLDIERR